MEGAGGGRVWGRRDTVLMYNILKNIIKLNYKK